VDAKPEAVYGFRRRQKVPTVKVLSKVLNKPGVNLIRPNAVDSRSMPTHERAYDASPQ